MSAVKLETLNIWGGKIHQPLISHVQEQGHIVDIFCLQEIINGQRDTTMPPQDGGVVDIYSQLQAVLPDHRGYFASSQQEEGLAIFVRKTVPVVQTGDVFVHRSKDSWIEGQPGTKGRNLQYVQLQHQGKPLTIANLHGLWNGQGKTDTPDRLAQSQKTKVFLDSQTGAKILCGDFNLLPQTQSLAILAEGMRDLVTEYGVVSTRSAYYKKPDQYADYILVSPEVKVRDFRVLPDAVSDHLPLQVDFE